MIRQYVEDGELLSVELTPCLNCNEPCLGDYCGPGCYCDGEGAVECDCGEIHDENIECPACGENEAEPELTHAEIDARDSGLPVSAFTRPGFDGNGLPRRGRR